MKFVNDNELNVTWEPLVQTFAAMITLAPEFVVLQTYTPHGGECGPYVQTLQEVDGALTLEAARNDFLDPPLSPDGINTLLEMGWTAPEGIEGAPNFRIFLEPDEVNPGIVARFLIRTLRDAYMVTTKDQFEFAPHQLFVEVMNGDFGVSPAMEFAKFDIEEWKRKNTRRPR